jgi:hypothetical protein
MERFELINTDQARPEAASKSSIAEVILNLLGTEKSLQHISKEREHAQ